MEEKDELAKSNQSPFSDVRKIVRRESNSRGVTGVQVAIGGKLGGA